MGGVEGWEVRGVRIRDERGEGKWRVRCKEIRKGNREDKGDREARGSKGESKGG